MKTNQLGSFSLTRKEIEGGLFQKSFWGAFFRMPSPLSRLCGCRDYDMGRKLIDRYCPGERNRHSLYLYPRC